MSSKTLIKIVLIVFVAGSLAYAAFDEFGGGNGTDEAREDQSGGPAETAAGTEPGEAEEFPRYVAWYFYGTKRCRTCINIENFTTEAIEEYFADSIEAGELEMRAVNVEMPRHEHFIEDFELVNKSVVLAEYEDGRVVRWENLDRIWELAGDREAFKDYIRSETADFMMGGPVE